jgi:hypothetical protein
VGSCTRWFHKTQERLAMNESLGSDWSRAADAKAELIEWWKREDNIDYGARISWMLLPDEAFADPRTAQVSCFAWACWQSAALQMAPTYFVNADMATLVAAAAAVMPAEPFLPSDAPTDSGFAFFADPPPLPGCFSGEAPFRAFSWRRIEHHHDGRTGTEVVLYADKRAVMGQPDFLPRRSPRPGVKGPGRSGGG